MDGWRNNRASNVKPKLEVQKNMAEQKLPIVYTIRGCDACVKLLDKWNGEGIEFEERRADLSQEILDEARTFGDVVPIVVYPDGKVEEGFEGGIGCHIG
mgnify:CR=1 FL=1